MSSSRGYALAIHGGAGLIRRDTLSPEREEACSAALRESLAAGEAILQQGGTALDAVVASVEWMEDSPLFNAGRGGVLAASGEVEMDAAVMCGLRSAGAISGARRVKNPVRLARRLMECSPHVFLNGLGADQFAEAQGLPLVEPSYFITRERREQWERARERGLFTLDHGGAEKDVYGTVGAVARDRQGGLAAATSTGGMVNKLAGRVGDTPVIGAGTYASEGVCAVSCTGHGEPFIRHAVAARLAHWMELGGLSLAEASHRIIHEELSEGRGQGGLIAVSAEGEIALPFNTGGMFRAWTQEHGARGHGIW